MVEVEQGWSVLMLLFPLRNITYAVVPSRPAPSFDVADQLQRSDLYRKP